jgi:hypothetical protein
MADQSSAAVAAQRVQAIIEAAEATAREIRENARAETAALVEQAARLRTQMDEIEAALVELKASVDSASTEPAAPATQPVAPEPVAPEPEPEPASADPDTPASSPPAAGQVPEGARLIALNMALKGTPRDETARYLRENFNLNGADALLDEVYAKAGS